MNFNFDEDSLVYISRYFNKNFISLTSIRQKQNSKFVRYIRKKALEKMGDWPQLADPRLFYVGSVDFMVTEYNGQPEFVILETNGGSSRGFLSVGSDQIEMIFNSYKLAIDQSFGDDQKRILIGTLPNDDLFQEKIMLAEFLKNRYEIEGFKVGIYNSFNYEPPQKKNEDFAIIIANYNNLFDHLSFHHKHIAFKGEEVHVIIGDGVARRFPIVGAYIKNDWKSVKTTIVNTIYNITDDKASTYLAAYLGQDLLEDYRIHPLQFGRVYDPYHLEEILEYLITNNKNNYVIKPFGGSGGAGVQPVLRTHSKENIPKIMEASISDFYNKFDSRRNPFPYTIQEMAKFSLVDWNGSKRAYDLRIYVIQQNGHLFPIGGEARIARAPYTGKFEKEEFVVNICGKWGVDIDRAIPISPEGLKLLQLSEEDMINIFCAACEVFRIISEKYSDVLSYTGWDKFLKLGSD